MMNTFHSCFIQIYNESTIDLLILGNSKIWLNSREKNHPFEESLLSESFEKRRHFLRNLVISSCYTDTLKVLVKIFRRELLDGCSIKQGLGYEYFRS